jgi:purine-nucleoside phosphorylase
MESWNGAAWAQKARELTRGNDKKKITAIHAGVTAGAAFVVVLVQLLLSKAIEAGKAIGQNVVPGPVFSSDCFYEQGCTETSSAKLMKLGVLCVEMEAHALYLNAAVAGKNALALLTISDHLLTGEALPAEERQTTFTKMMEIALEIA